MRRARPAGGPHDTGHAGHVESLRILRRVRSGQVRKRRRGRGALLAGAALTACAVLTGAAGAARHYLTHSPRFALRHVDFSETRYAPEEDLRRSLTRYVGRNLFRIDPTRLARDLESRRWVKRAVVKRVLPDGVFCAVEERVPRGLALLRDRVWLVDEEGVAIDPYGGPAQQRYSFPILVGIDDGNSGRARVQIRRGVQLIVYLEAEYPETAREISEVDLSRDDRLELRMNQGGPAVRLSPHDFGGNLERYLTLRNYLATDFGGGAYVDLRFKDRIAFRPLVASNAGKGD